MTKAINKPFTLISGKEAIVKEIKLIGLSGVKFDHRVHVAAVSCVAHIKEHGDNTLLLNLYRILPDSFRRNSFLAWCEDFGGVEVITKDPETGKSLKKDAYVFKKRENVTDEMVTEAISHPPMTYKKGSEGTAYAGFDLRDEINKLIGRAANAQKKVNDGKASSDVVKIDKDVLQFLKYYGTAGRLPDSVTTPVVAKPATEGVTLVN